VSDGNRGDLPAITPADDATPELPVVVGRGRDEIRRVSDSQVTMTQLMSPQDTNLFGNVFGGVILAAVDRIAYVCAARHAGGPCVTASFDQVDFRSPIQIGEIVTLEASINAVGKTSAEVGVRVSAENVQGDGRRHTNSCYVTMVAIDDAGHPIPMPRLVIETEDELRRYQDAEERKKARLLLARSRAARQG
jgi:acyl-CoA hydrolase